MCFIIVVHLLIFTVLDYSRSNINQGLPDDLDATLVSEVYISRQTFIYSFYSKESRVLDDDQG